MKNQNGQVISTDPYKLKPLDAFSKEERHRAGKDCPAISRYLSLITKLPKDTSQSLRIQRHKYWLTCALNTYFFPEKAEAVCEYWSIASEEILTKAFVEADLASEEVLLAGFGKLGAHELNLSSDVDLILISKNPPHQELIKKVQTFNQLISRQTEFGFCYRTDYDLRPGGRLGPLVSSIQQLQDYYWAQGETWERMAYIRFNPIAGPNELQKEMQSFVERFSYRKFIDLTLFEDLQNLRHKIQSFNYQNTDTEGQIHLKLDIGAIRDIELFIHANCIIHGGRISSIRGRKTRDLYNSLFEQGLLNTDGLSLIDNYWKLRQWENLVQTKEDSQTHVLKLNNQQFPFISDQDANALRQQIIKTKDIVIELLGDKKPAEATLPESFESQQAWLHELGFNETSINETWPKLIALTAKSQNIKRDEQARRRFLYLFVNKLSFHRKGKNLGLSRLSDFVRAIHAKATFFTLLIQEESLLTNLARVFASSPYLSSLFTSRPELLDSLFYKKHNEISDNLEQALDDMAERRLLTEIVASFEFLSELNISKLCQALTHCADTICLRLLELLHKEYGASGLGIVALGKWGGEELGISSDLDFIFVTEQTPSELDNKIARRFISRLQDEHRGGKIYSVDLRLRPSGNAGPLLVSKQRLKNYLIESAEPWVRQSYLRCRSLCSFITDEEIRSWALSQNITSDDLSEFERIKSKLLVKNKEDEIDLKFCRGGLVDIEFAIQQNYLCNSKMPGSANTLEQLTQHKQLVEVYTLFRTYEQLIKLLTTSSGCKVDFRSETTELLSQVMGAAGKQELKLKLIETLDRSHSHLKGLDPQTRTS